MRSPSDFFSVPHRALWKNTKSSYKPNREENGDIVALLQATQSALEQLQSKVWQGGKKGKLLLKHQQKAQTSWLTCATVMVVKHAVCFVPSVCIPEQRGPESSRLLSKLTACSSVWPPATDGHLQPCLWDRPESLLQQRPPQLQLRDRSLSEGPTAAAGLQHGTHK